MSNAARKYPLFVNEFFMKRVNLFMNILPEVGLYNGAIGTVFEIVYNNRPEGPNDKEHYHLPDYVVVDFPNLKLPDGISNCGKLRRFAANCGELRCFAAFCSVLRRCAAFCGEMRRIAAF